MHNNAVRFALISSFALSAYSQAPAGGLERVFYLTHTDTQQEMNEIATVVRSVGDIHPLLAKADDKSLTVHGTRNQLALAEWLVGQLNRPAPPPADAQVADSVPQEYRLPGVADDVVRVFYLTYSRTPQQGQEILTAIRAVADVPRIFIYSKLKAVAVRGTAAQIDLAGWLVSELNQPAPAREAGFHEHRMGGQSDDVARVFYLPRAQTVQELQQVAVAVRESTDMHRLFINNARRVLTARGTAEQMASAERIIARIYPAR